MKIRSVVVVMAVVLLSAVVGSAGSLRHEATLPFQLDKALEIGATVGPVSVASVTFSEEAPKGGGIGARVMGKMRRGDDDVESVLKLAFDCENPEKDEWEVTFVVELYDRQGKLIDRFTRSQDFEAEAQVYTCEHVTLKYIVPLVHKVKISLRAEAD